MGPLELLGGFFKDAGKSIGGAVVDTAKAINPLKGFFKDQPVADVTSVSSKPKVAESAPLAAQEWTYKDDKRGEIKMTEDQLNRARGVFYGEIGNRDTAKKELEARVIMNTAMNRVGEFNRLGTPKTIQEVLEDASIYQAYGGDQYNLYNNPDKMNELDKKKKAEVDAIMDKIINEIKSGKFEDNTNQSFYYVHNPDGTISFDDKRPLWEDRDLRKR